MSTIGDGLGMMARPEMGVGFPMRPEDIPGVQTLEYSDFSGGLMISANKAALPRSASPDVLDMEPKRNGRLICAPGILVSSTNVGKTLKNFFNQGGLDYTGKLIFIEPPNVGVMSLLGGAIAFTNEGVAAVTKTALQYNAVNYGDELIFSNGTAATYSRDASAGTVADISANIVARTFMSLFGRLFAGAVTSGTYQALAVFWNGSSALSTDWTGADSGAELLIADTGTADEIVAMRPIGQDVGAILMRNSLWAAYKTNEANRPADFKLRFVGFGCVSELTVAVTAGGVTFLSDAGVVNYNINTAEIISHDINNELLPLNVSSLDIGLYRAAYDAVNQRYILITPLFTYVYDFPREGAPGRWTKRYDLVNAETAPDGLAMFRPLPSAQLHIPVPVFTNGGTVGYEDYSTSTTFGAALHPRWLLPADPNLAYDRFVQTIGMYITYKSPGFSFGLTVSTRDANDVTLESQVVGINQELSPNGTDRFVPLALRGVSSSLLIAPQAAIPGFEILRIRQLAIDAGPASPSL